MSLVYIRDCTSTTDYKAYIACDFWIAGYPDAKDMKITMDPVASQSPVPVITFEAGSIPARERSLVSVVMWIWISAI